MIKIVTWSLCITLYFAACKSTQAINTTATACELNFELTERAQLLLDKQWSETSIKVLRRAGEAQTMDVTDQFMPSDLDDVIIFHRDGTFLFDEGASKARQESQQVYGAGSWTLIEENKQLVLCSQSKYTIYEVVDLAPDQLILQLGIDKPDESYTYELIYHPSNTPKN